RLRERSMGVYQGLSIDALRRDGRMSALLGWQGSPTGGESLSALATRCLSAVSEIDASEPVLIFAHGGVIRVLTGMLDGLTTEQIASRRIENAVPMAREVDEGVWSACSARYLVAQN
ncbi:MAG: broad specificity phosphatase PhoE, partial [Myxococcota bacterium]